MTGWSVDDDYPYHLWLIKSTGEEDTYTIQNAVAGTYMDMAQGDLVRSSLRCAVLMAGRRLGQEQYAGRWLARRRAGQAEMDH